jgi:hypothetical protein
MPILKPQLQLTRNDFQGLLAPDSEGKKVAKQILDQAGLSLEEIAAKMSEILNYTDDNPSRLRVIEKALQVHGALEPERSGGNTIAIQFSFAGAEEGTSAMQILIPR